MTTGHSAGRIATFLLIAAAAAVRGPGVRAAGPLDTSCVACHGRMGAAGGDGGIVAQFRADIHAAAGLSCHDCHGGNPDIALAADEEAAHASRAGAPFVGAVSRTEIPRMCGSCHSDPDVMKKYRPNAHVDQEREYWTSGHGKALRRGDTNTPTCVDCHATHDIRPGSDEHSRVHPLRVAEMCAACHSDAARMKGARGGDGRPLPIDQYALWRRSVHAGALLDRGDHFAPTCNDCHGNHGTAPPGVGSVSFVCGQCHGREASLFRGSPKQARFDRHNEYYLPDMEAAGCGTCHKITEPSARMTDVRHLAGCVTCHQNHAIIEPSIAMLPHQATTPCALCHGAEGALAGDGGAPAPRTSRARALGDALEAEGRKAGLEGGALFGWLVDRTLALPQHTSGVATGRDEPPALRAEFARLFEKFRIDRTRAVPPPAGEGGGPLVQCADCHAAEPRLSSVPVGLETAAGFSKGMRELMEMTTEAQVSILEARRGGVEVGGALLDLDRAIDAQVQLQVLVHTFSYAKGSPFVEQHGDGMAHARAAQEKGEAAVEELGSRRQGLAIWLGLGALALVGLRLGRRLRSA